MLEKTKTVHKNLSREKLFGLAKLIELVHWK